MEANGSSTQSEVDVARMPQMGMFVLERMAPKIFAGGPDLVTIIGNLQLEPTSIAEKGAT